MNPLVAPDWVAAQLQDPNTVLLDATFPPVGITPPADMYARYLSGHLPGAVFFDIDRISDQATSLPHMLSTPENFARSMAELGVSDSMTLIVYEQAGVFSAPRAWWTLRAFGARKVHLLDGGLEAWRQAGLPLEPGEVRRPPAYFRASLDPHAVVDFAQLQALLSNHAQVLDARSAGRFNGSSPEPRPGISSGHMPGAISLPFSELLKEGRLLPPDELRRIFQTKGVDLEEPVTTTCGSGVTAAVLQLALELAGAKQVNLYDGSWAEYAQHPEAIIEPSST